MNSTTLKPADYLIIFLIMIGGILLSNIFFNKTTIITQNNPTDSIITNFAKQLEERHDTTIILKSELKTIKEHFNYEKEIFSYIPDSLKFAYIYNKSLELLTDSIK